MILVCSAERTVTYNETELDIILGWETDDYVMISLGIMNQNKSNKDIGWPFFFSQHYPRGAGRILESKSSTDNP